MSREAPVLLCIFGMSSICQGNYPFVSSCLSCCLLPLRTAGQLLPAPHPNNKSSNNLFTQSGYSWALINQFRISVFSWHLHLVLAKQRSQHRLRVLEQRCFMPRQQVNHELLIRSVPDSMQTTVKCRIEYLCLNNAPEPSPAAPGLLILDRMPSAHRPKPPPTLATARN